MMCQNVLAITSHSFVGEIIRCNIVVFVCLFICFCHGGGGVEIEGFQKKNIYCKDFTVDYLRQAIAN